MTLQACPNCQTPHDVGVYVTGQKILCKCGIHFEVKRTDVSALRSAPTTPARVTARPPANEATPNVVSLEVVPPPADQVPTGDGDEQTFIAHSSSVVIPGYELLDLLGRGGMGEVWRAKQTSLHRTVAVKLLPPRLAKDPEFVARFEKEATALAALSHPNIIQIIDRGVAGEHYYFVMEYVEGRSLRDLINGRRLPAPEALRIVLQIARAIDYAHEKQIIHRDLKPENILVDDRGHVKVADFGLAGIRGSEQRLQLTATSVAMGTVNYMAPEQRRDAKHVDGRADLYSLGVVMYELLTGELPIGRFKLPSEKVPGLDRRLDDIVAKSLETDPEQRYASAATVVSELELLVGSGIASLPPPPSVSTVRDRPAVQKPESVIERGFKGLRVGLSVVATLAVIGVAVKLLTAKDTPKVDLQIGDAKLQISLDAKDKEQQQAAGRYPPNTNSELFTGSTWADLGAGRGRLTVSFDGEGEEEINAHSGTWKLDRGLLSASQAGNDPGEDRMRLIPRAYVAHRYFSTDDFTLEADMQIRPLEADVPVEENAQHFGEVAMRIKDLQVSIFAIPDAGMRLMWRYFTPDGVEQVGNSARDVMDYVEDHMPVPRGRFRVKLQLKRVKSGVDVSAYVNGQRFARKVLVGIEGQTGKIAVGCRNLHCAFDELVATGKVMDRPQLRKPE